MAIFIKTIKSSCEWPILNHIYKGYSRNFQKNDITNTTVTYWFGHFHKNNKIQLWMAHFKPLLHTLRWLQIGIWTLYQVIFELWKLFTWIRGQKSFWRSFDSVFFKYNTLTLTSKIALIGQFWSPTTPLKMKKFKKNFQIPWSYPKTFNFWEN